MCTLVILRRPGHAWPVLIAGNRDEMVARPSQAPARHWPDRPEVVAGLDEQAGGSWLGVNDHGLVAAVMDREGALGSAPGKRTRGELVLEALDHAQAEEAARALADLCPDAYRPFNLLVADPVSAYWVRHGGDGRIGVQPVPSGLHLLAGADLDDPLHPRIRFQRPRFAAAQVPDPERGDWLDWQRLLRSSHLPEGGEPAAAMLQDRPDGFGTRSSALIALPAYPGFQARPVWLHAGDPPDPETFRVVM